jgi:hypothetical protein
MLSSESFLLKRRTGLSIGEKTALNFFPQMRNDINLTILNVTCLEPSLIFKGYFSSLYLPQYRNLASLLNSKLHM